MPKIKVTARFEVRFNKTISAAQLKRLEAGAPVSDLVDESEAYREAATGGECDMEWDLPPKTASKAPKSKQ
jgi:hypothetical protein